MPNAYRGIPGNVSGNYPAALSISSSTFTTPGQITTTTAHNLVTGDIVNVYGHQTNANLNGQWTITVLSTTQFSLNGSSAGGTGGATGKVQPLTMPSFNQPSDGDGRNAASVNVPLDALADRTSLLLPCIGSYKWRNSDFATGSPTLGYQAHDDTFSGGTWANLGASEGSLSTNTIYPLVGTGGGGSPLPWLITADAQPGDLLEVQLDTTWNYNTSTFATAGAYFFLQFSPNSPGTSPLSWSKVLGSVKFLTPPSSASNLFYPQTLKGYFSISSNFTPVVYVRPAIYVPSSGAGVGGGQFHLFADWFLECRHWRLTGVPQ